MTPLKEAVSRTPYPGRGIVIGKSEDGASAVIAYFIMGRSENSRNRVFVEEGEGIRTQAHDPSKLSDPSLIIYSPVRAFENHTIVTNGDQTDTIYEHLMAGGTFESALRARAFEPDAPNYTPRISGLVTLEAGRFAYKMSILKSANGNPDACLRFFFEYETPLAGQGHFLHTYEGDGDPLPSFAGEPEPVALRGGIDDVRAEIWEHADPDNRVSLFVRFVNLQSGQAETRITNKLG